MPTDRSGNFIAAVLRVQMAREAAASVSLSHPENCVCTVCRALDEDDDTGALAEVMELLRDD